MKKFMEIELETLKLIEDLEHDAQYAFENGYMEEEYCKNCRETLHKAHVILSTKYDSYNRDYMTRKLKEGMYHEH